MAFISLDHIGNIKIIENSDGKGLNVVSRAKIELDPAYKPLSACWIKSLIAFDGRNGFAVGRRNGNIEFWSFSDFLQLIARTVVNEPVLALNHFDDKIFAVGSLNNIYVISLSNIAKSCIKCHIESVVCMCNGEDKENFFPLLQKIPHQTTVSCASFSKLAPIIAISSNSTPSIWDATLGKVIWKAKSRKASLLKLQRCRIINCICFLDSINQNVIAVGYGDGSVVIYDARIQKRPVFEFSLSDKRERGDKKENFFKKIHDFDLSSRFPKFIAVDRDAPLRPIITINLIDNINNLESIEDFNYNDCCDLIITDSAGNIAKVTILTGNSLIKELKVNSDMEENKVWETLVKARKLIKSYKTNDAPVAHAKSGPQFSAKVVAHYQPHKGAVVHVSVADSKFVTASLDQTCALYSVKSSKMLKQILLLEKQSLVLF